MNTQESIPFQNTSDGRFKQAIAPRHDPLWNEEWIVMAVL